MNWRPGRGQHFPRPGAQVRSLLRTPKGDTMRKMNFIFAVLCTLSLPAFAADEGDGTLLATA